MSYILNIVLASVAVVLFGLLVVGRKREQRHNEEIQKQIEILGGEVEKATAEILWRKSGAVLLYRSACNISLYSQLAAEEAQTESLKEKQQVILSECQKALEILQQEEM